ncbi:MAG: M20/M25/M40 family metallo-hydrolase, partial [Thermodesulfobacteriota bacterium]
MINRERLADTFVSLVKIDSESRNEKAVCAFLADLFQAMGGAAVVDDAGARIGGNSGNLIVRFAGDPGIEPMLLCAHMDTVSPGAGIDPVLTDGVFSSRGDTILGADDKSAIAVIIEALRVVRAQGGPVCPIDLVITVCEEIGLVGAKHLDTTLFAARNGYVLDAADTAGIVTR